VPPGPHAVALTGGVTTGEVARAPRVGRTSRSSPTADPRRRLRCRRAHEAEARTAIAMAANAQRVIVAVDGSKIGTVTLAKMVPLERIHHLVTDSTADRQQLKLIHAAGVQVHEIAVD